MNTDELLMKERDFTETRSELTEDLWLLEQELLDCLREIPGHTRCVSNANPRDFSSQKLKF